MPEVILDTETQQGWVEAISPKPEKDHYGIKLDNDKWYNGEGSLPGKVERGKLVEIDFFQPDPNQEFRKIEDIKVVDKESKPKDSKAQKEKKGAEPSGEGSGSTTDSKPNKYDIGMCFKDALNKASPHQDKEEYIEQVVKFTNWNLEARQRVKNQ